MDDVSNIVEATAVMASAVLLYSGMLYQFGERPIPSTVCIQ